MARYAVAVLAVLAILGSACVGPLLK
jgi:hypothetical protein